MIVSVLLWRQPTVLPEWEWEAGDRNQEREDVFVCFCYGRKFSCNNIVSPSLLR